MDEIDLAADEDAHIGEPLDYDQNDDWDSDDEEWEKGLDPQQDSDVLAVPRELRYRAEDIDWVVKELDSKAAKSLSHIRNAMTSMEQEARSRLDRDGNRIDSSSSFFNETTSKKIQRAGADVAKFERLMSTFSGKQLLALFSLEIETKDIASGAATFEGVPGLSQDQIDGLVELESYLHEEEQSVDTEST